MDTFCVEDLEVLLSTSCQVVTKLTPLAPPTKGLMKGVAGAVRGGTNISLGCQFYDVQEWLFELSSNRVLPKIDGHIDSMANLGSCTAIEGFQGLYGLHAIPFGLDFHPSSLTSYGGRFLGHNPN